MKKEEIYVNLQGKTKKELTDLFEFLKENNERTYNKSVKTFIIEFTKKDTRNKGLEFFDGIFIGSDNDENKTEVTIEQLKQIIKPMGTLKIEDVMIDCSILNNDAIKLIETIFNSKGHGVRYIRKPFSKGNDIIMAECKNPDHKKLISFAKFKKLFNNQTSLEQQLQKAEAEVKRLQSLIEEENKPKVGDWAMLWEEDEKTPVFGLITDVNDYFLTCNGSWEFAKKITNPELIKLLENECSTKN